MEPIGTITSYFPHIDPETKEILSTIMHDSYNLRDFTHALTERVCNSESSDELVFFAVHFAALLFDFDCLDRIAKLYGKLDIIRPNLFYGTAIQGHPEDLKKVRDAIDEVLVSNPKGWLKLEMHMIKFEAENAEYPKEVYDSSTLDTIEAMVAKEPDFDFIRARLYDSLSIRGIREGDNERALELNQMAIEKAENYNDINRLAHLYRTRAGIIQSSDRAESHRLLIQSRDLMKSMGDQGGYADVLFLLSKLESIRGKYDLAIEYNLECVKIWETIGMPIGMFALTLSTLYNVTGDSDAGLEWGKMAESELASRPMMQPRAILNQAWSEVLKRNLIEAEILLDSIQSSILKSGLESNLAWLYFVTSVIDSIEGDFASAASNVEESMDIYERTGGLVSFFICLNHRALIEVTDPESGISLGNTNRVGPWLMLLEEKARSEDLPGILGLALLHKARWLSARGEGEEANNILSEVEFLIAKEKLEFLMPYLHRLQNSDS